MSASPRSASAAEPEDAYYNVPLADLKIIEGQLPGRDEETAATGVASLADPRHSLMRAGRPGRSVWRRTALVVVGRILMSPHEGQRRSRRAPAKAACTNQDRLVVRAPKGREVVGRVFFPQLDAKKSAVVKFQIPAGAATDQRQAFLTVKEMHYAGLQGRNIPGAAWFRHEANAARAELGKIEASRRRCGDERRLRHSVPASCSGRTNCSAAAGRCARTCNWTAP